GIDDTEGVLDCLLQDVAAVGLPVDVADGGSPVVGRELPRDDGVHLLAGAPCLLGGPAKGFLGRRGTVHADDDPAAARGVLGVVDAHGSSLRASTVRAQGPWSWIPGPSGSADVPGRTGEPRP